MHNAPTPVGHMRRLPKVAELTKKWTKTRSDLVRVESDGTIRIFDVQSRLETDLAYDQKMNAVEACLNHDRKFHMSPVKSLNLLCNIVSSHTLGTRSENDWNELLCCNFTRRVNGI